MADGYVTNAGSGGLTFASDDDGTWQWPLVKLGWGPNGTFNYAGLTAPVPVQTSIESGQMTAGGVVVTPKFVIIDAATSGDNTILASVSGKKIRVLNLVLVAAGAVNVRFESGAGGTALTGQMNLVANTGFSSGYCPVGHFETAATTLLNLELSAAVSVDGWLVYVEV